MTEVILSGFEITSKGALHTHLALELDLPEWYGRNLDALYDCLTDLKNDVRIILPDFPILEEQLGRYAQALLSTLKDAAAENPHIHIIIE